MTSFNKNGMINIEREREIINLYTGRQYNYSNIGLVYNCKTDLFKNYGFNDALQLTACDENNRLYFNDTTKTFLAYSYILDPSLWKASTDYVISCYAYNAANTDFDITVEGSCQYTSCNTNTSYNLNNLCVKSDIKNEVFWFWAKFKTASTGQLKVMFYPNHCHTTNFTEGYQLIAGMTIYEGTEVYRPSYDNKIHGIYTLPSQKSIYEDRLEFDNYIEY